MFPTIIYTDGSRLEPIPVGGWACCLVGQHRGRLHYVELMGSKDSASSSHEMECLAVYNALKALDRPSKVVLFTDSQFVVQKFSVVKSWEYHQTFPKGLNEFKDLTEKIVKLLRIHDVTFQWVKGHKNENLNNRCNRLARKSAEARLHRFLGEKCAA